MRGLLASESAMSYLVFWRKTNVRGDSTTPGCIVEGEESSLIDFFGIPRNRFRCYTSFWSVHIEIVKGESELLHVSSWNPAATSRTRS